VKVFNTHLGNHSSVAFLDYFVKMKDYDETN